MSETVAYKVTGEETIHCQACEQRIGRVLRRLRGVEDVKALGDHDKQEALRLADRVADRWASSRMCSTTRRSRMATDRCAR